MTWFWRTFLGKIVGGLIGDAIRKRKKNKLITHYPFEWKCPRCPAFCNGTSKPTVDGYAIEHFELHPDHKGD